MHATLTQTADPVAVGGPECRRVVNRYIARVLLDQAELDRGEAAAMLSPHVAFYAAAAAEMERMAATLIED